MSRLWVRLTVAFVLVTLLMAVLVTVAVAWSAGRQFRGYLAEPAVFARGASLEVLQGYFEQHGSWDGVASAIRPARGRARTRPDTADGPGKTGSAGGSSNLPLQPLPARDPNSPPIMVADAHGKIVYDDRRARLGQTLSTSELGNALSITVSDTVAGYVLASAPDFNFVGSPEQRFLDDLQRSIVIAALGAVVIGIVLGLLISRSLSKPLATVAQAAHGFAARDWSRRVPMDQTKHIAEVSEVASAFNNMADSLERSEAERRNLMADVAHELRTPLTVVQGLLRALLDGVHTLQMSEIAAIYDETRLLSRLVDDVRELALAEAQQLPLILRPVDMTGLLGVTVNRFAAAADAGGIRLDLHVPDSVPAVQADPDRVTQVLQNLVSNAFRHTPQGGRVALQVEATSQPGQTVVVSVRDTGEGISAEDLPHVFDRFYRGDKSRARISGGSGLGLSIVKALVEGMGGAVGVDSTPGQGSRFWFTLPSVHG